MQPTSDQRVTAIITEDDLADGAFSGNEDNVLSAGSNGNSKLRFGNSCEVSTLCVEERYKKGVATATPFDLEQGADSVDRLDDSIHHGFRLDIVPGQPGRYIESVFRAG